MEKFFDYSDRRTGKTQRLFSKCLNNEISQKGLAKNRFLIIGCTQSMTIDLFNQYEQYLKNYKVTSSLFQERNFVEKKYVYRLGSTYFYNLQHLSHNTIDAYNFDTICFEEVCLFPKKNVKDLLERFGNRCNTYFNSSEDLSGISDTVKYVYNFCDKTYHKWNQNSSSYDIYYKHKLSKEKTFDQFFLKNGWVIE